MEPFWDYLIKLGLSVFLGGVLGIEREYRCRPAGFRTITLICVGATIYTIVSQILGNHLGDDRVAANIVTGVGFIGAGVIFKTGNNVYGLTSAATIWIAAAMGMSVAAGEFVFSCIILIVALTILMVFEYIQEQLDIFNKKRAYIIVFEGHTLDDKIEAELYKLRLSYVKLKEKRNRNQTTCEYEVFGRNKQLDEFNEYLLGFEQVISFEY